jgi:hypothetical protein
MTFVADTINFREIVMKEPLPLATIQTAVIDFVRGRNDCVLFGAQAVNVYVTEPRATQDVDLMSTRAGHLAEELCANLREKFHIAVRVREIKKGEGYRLFQIRKTGNRHLVDVRSVDSLPPSKRLDGVLVLTPAELIVSKVVSYYQRRGKPKSGTDWRDLALLMLRFPQFQSDPRPITKCLKAAGATQPVLDLWRDLAAQEIVAENEEEDF